MTLDMGFLATVDKIVLLPKDLQLRFQRPFLRSFSLFEKWQQRYLFIQSVEQIKHKTAIMDTIENWPCQLRDETRMPRIIKSVSSCNLIWL